MAAVAKIPLKERLRAIGTNKPNFLAAFELFINDFFLEIAKITRSKYFESVYYSFVAEYNDQNGGCVLTEIVHRADELPSEEKLDLLYTVLVEPFAALKDRKEAAP